MPQNEWNGTVSGTEPVSSMETQNAGAPQSRRRRRKKEKKPESFLLFYLLPFIIINVLIFRYMTAQPDFILTMEDCVDNATVSFSVEMTGRLPVKDFQVRLDDVPVETEEVEPKLFRATVARNGTLEVTAGYRNGMIKTQYEHISTIDDISPVIVGEELDGTMLTVSVSDEQSGIDFSSIYALDGDGHRLTPVSVDEAEQRVVFQVTTDTIEVHASDLVGNEAIASYSGLSSMGNGGGDRTGDYHQYGAGTA